MGIAYKKASITQRYTVLKEIKSKWDPLELLLSLDLVSIDIAWVVIKVIKQHYLNFTKQTGTIMHN